MNTEIIRSNNATNGSVRQDVNRAEWESPDNWGGPRWAAVYFSKRDTRTWVLKKIPWMGWTVNLASPSGVAWLFGIMAGIPLFMVLVFWLGAACR